MDMEYDIHSREAAKVELMLRNYGLLIPRGSKDHYFAFLLVSQPYVNLHQCVQALHWSADW